MQSVQNTAFVQSEFLDGKDKKAVGKRHPRLKHFFQWESSVTEIIAVKLLYPSLRQCSALMDLEGSSLELRP